MVTLFKKNGRFSPFGIIMIILIVVFILLLIFRLIPLALLLAVGVGAYFLLRYLFRGK